MWPWWLSSEASAHRPGLSYARIDDEVAVVFAEPELAERFPIGDDLGAVEGLLADTILARASVTTEAGACALLEPRARRVENDGIEIAASLSCPSAGRWTFRAGYLADFDEDHRQLVEANGLPVGLLAARRDTVVFDGGSDRAEVAVRFAELGVEHIWTGYDHVAFLLALMLGAGAERAGTEAGPAGRATARELAKELLGIATGFTIAHSVTLSLAATGVLTLPPRIVEPAIAATIVYVGLENLWRPTPRRRLATTFGLGLVHGFGFAGMLAELGLPGDALGIALAAFNAGVELGQAAILVVAIPAIVVARRSETWNRRGAPAVSLLVAAAGGYWLVTRLLAG